MRPELQQRKNPQGRSRLLWMAHSRRGRERAWATRKVDAFGRNTPKIRRDPSGHRTPLRMTAAINSGDDEHSELRERYFGAKATATTLNGHGVCTTRRHSQQARATSVGILFEDVSGRSAHALAERQLAQTCEFVGAISKREGWQFRATHRKRRGASRRST